MSGTDKTLPPAIRLYSFGYKHTGIPEPLIGSHMDGRGGGFVFDCRALPNPFWDESLRPYTGLDQPVDEFMLRDPLTGEYLEHVEALVLTAARRYREQGKPALHVAFGCTGGRHRSVWQAERLFRRLESEGFQVSLEHLDIHHQPGKPTTPPPPAATG